MCPESGPNHLIDETSPYLLQHAHNPVDWYPWSSRAFEIAQQEDKPIFLSIGYSTCHWCHVMERESFEDDEVAELLNSTFVCIKVDREERPDIDSIYMEICQMMTGQGGWPLTIMMTPQKKPFFAGTFIPKESRYGMTGLKSLTERVGRLWEEDRDRLVRSAEEATSALVKYQAKGGAGKGLDVETLFKAGNELKGAFDSEYGGFGPPPKFPTPHRLLLLLKIWYRNGDVQALNMVERTLTSMRLGGMYDHAGKGFHRYSTDRRWKVPHFEKMLYDQAMLAMAYSEAYQITERPLFRNTAEEIFEYVLRDMTSSNGGFFSAEDADSEGEEGAFYLWKEEEIRRVLPDELTDSFIETYNISPQGNFKDEASREKTGKNILYLNDVPGFEPRQNESQLVRLKSDIRGCLDLLFQAREKRTKPLKDDKILTDWNGLMVAALSKGGLIFERPDLIRSAEDAVQFIFSNMRDGRLFHSYREEKVSENAFLSDYAYLLWGLLELYEATLDEKLLTKAIDLCYQMIDRYWDHEDSGFFMTSDEAEEVLLRKKNLFDGSLPSGNSVAMYVLSRLSRLTGDSTLEEYAFQLSKFFSSNMVGGLRAYCQFLIGLDFAIGPTREVVIVGDVSEIDTQGFIDALRSRYLPRTSVLLKPSGDSPLLDRVEFIKAMQRVDGKPTAYLCTGGRCYPPVDSPHRLLSLLDETSSS